MNRVDRIYHPEAIRDRADLRRALEADLPIVTPVWIASPGGAAMCATPARTAGGGSPCPTHVTAARVPFPKPRNHAEEIANARAEAAHC
jgi:hypothetical protein